MFTFRARLALFTLLVAFAVPASGAALAKTGTTHSYGSTIQTVMLSSGDGYPNPGGRVVLAGTWVTNTFGTGALVDHTTITGHPASNVFTFKGTEIDYLSGGSLHATLTGRSTVQANGDQEIATSGRFIRGTGRYAGATGRFAFSGTVTSGSSTLNGHSMGAITY